MAKSKTRTKSRTNARLKAKIQAEKQRDNAIIALLGFCITSLVVISVNVAVMHLSVVPVCLLMIIEAGIAVMLHRAELWMHGVLVIAEIIAGAIMGKLMLVVLCIAIYVAATVAIKYLYIGEK